MAIVREVFEATARRDETMLALYAEDAVWDASRVNGGLDQGVKRGREEIRRYFREWHDAFSDSEYELDELVDAGEAVVSVARHRGRGRTSGLALEREIAGVWTLVEGRIARVVWFWTRAEALAAADATAAG